MRGSWQPPLHVRQDAVYLWPRLAMNHSAVNGPNVFINYLIKLYGALVASLGLLNGRNNVHYLWWGVSDTNFVYKQTPTPSLYKMQFFSTFKHFGLIRIFSVQWDICSYSCNPLINFTYSILDEIKNDFVSDSILLRISWNFYGKEKLVQARNLIVLNLL